MVADQKLKKVKPNDEINLEIDADLLVSINKLQDIQDELEKINEKASDEVLEIEKRYNVIRQPIYDKRNVSIEAIPEFWATAFLSHPALCELVTDEDHKIFKHLTSIEVEDAKDVKSGYSISFNFGPNPYFEDTKLTKTLTFLDDRSTSVTATSIKWKEGMGISNGVDEEKQGNKRSHLEESFFSWFSEAQQIDDINDVVAEIIKEDLWPNPLIYFNNDGEEEDSDEDEDKDEDEDDNDDEEEKDGEEDDEQDGDDDDE